MSIKFYTKLFNKRPIKQAVINTADLLCVEENLDQENYDVQISQEAGRFIINCEDHTNPLLVVIFRMKTNKYMLYKILIRQNDNRYIVYIDENDLMTSSIEKRINKIQSD